MFPTPVKRFISENEIKEFLVDKRAVFNHLGFIFHSIIKTHIFCSLIQIRNNY